MRLGRYGSTRCRQGWPSAVVPSKLRGRSSAISAGPVAAAAAVAAVAAGTGRLSWPPWGLVIVECALCGMAAMALAAAGDSGALMPAALMESADPSDRRPVDRASYTQRCERRALGPPQDLPPS